MGIIIGLDLGTTNSVGAFMEGRSPEIILTQEGDRLLPSMVAFASKGERLVGNPAKSQLITNTDTIYSVKRLVGKRYSEVAPYLDQFNYKIVEAENDMLKISVGARLFSPEEISAMILEKLKEAAESHLNDTVEGAIITVPAYFNDSQRQATKDAGEIAGLEVLRIINEPTAASLAFSLELDDKANLVVYDFGGGTIDISVLEVNGDVIKVLSTAGDINLGGNDFDILLADQLVKMIKEEWNVDLTEDKMAMQRIRDAAENAKKELSGVEECEINLPFIGFVDDDPIHFSKYYSRKQFEKLIEKPVGGTFEICSAALNRADLTIEDVDEVLLVGGSTRIPYVQKRIKSFFGKEPNKKVNPDEIVAMGAAIQASIAVGKSQDILLLDVIPLSLGVKTFGGAFTRVIDANTTIPTNRSLVFSTAEDNQDEVEINVYQGEREIAEENKLLGKFTLTGIRQAPKGVPRIEVTFNIDINGILKVSAIDLSTKSKKEILVSNSGLLPRNEINQIKKNAEKFKESDLKKRELIQVKNEIVNYIYMIKKLCQTPELEARLADEAKAMIREAGEIMEREVAQELDDIRSRLDDLNIRISAAVSWTENMQGESVTTITAAPAEKPVVQQEFQELQFEPTRIESNEPLPVQVPEIQLDFDPTSYVDPTEPPLKDKKPTQSVGEPVPMPENDFGDLDDLQMEPDQLEEEAKEIMTLKQKILQSLYDIEQYTKNLKLDKKLNRDCDVMLARAKAEIDAAVDENTFRRLRQLDRELDALSHRLDNVVGVSLGFVDANEAKPAKKESGSEPVKKDDTRPFQIYKG